MGILRRLFRRRKHPRFFVGKGTFVMIGPYTDKGRKIEILDISEGGLAFIYPGSRSELEDSGYLSLLSGETPMLDRLDFITACDGPAPGCREERAPFRRRGVQFRWLGVMDQRRLKEFIERHAVAPAQ